MLGKLLKHEWKSTWKLPTILSAFVLAMTLAGCLSFKMPMWRKIMSDSMDRFTFFDFLAVLILIAYFISIIIAAFTIMIYFAIRFYKNLYTDEGYLTHTLPVTPRQLIISKTLISALWSFLSSLLVLFSMLLLFYAWGLTVLGNDSVYAFVRVVNYYMPDIQAAFKEFGGISLTGFCILMLILTIIGSFSGMLTIYGCISIGQLFRRHKVAASILTYLVVTSLIQTVTSVAILPMTFGLINKADVYEMNLEPIKAAVMPMAAMTPLYYVSALFAIVSSVIFHCVSEYIMKHKLNLD